MPRGSNDQKRYPPKFRRRFAHHAKLTRGRRVLALAPLRAGARRRRFAPHRWEREYQRTVARAFCEVPLYREQWAEAGRILASPVPVAAAALHDEVARLCPLRAPFDPAREPSPWLGDVTELAECLSLADVLDVRVPVLEVRDQLVDWRSLGRRGPAYAPVLGPEARATPAACSAAITRAVQLAASAGRAVVVVAPHALDAAVGELRAAAPTVAFVPVLRLSLGEAAATSDIDTPVLLHDPHLGYLGARVPQCRAFHLAWWRCFVQFDDLGAMITRLDLRRPTLVDVRPDATAFAAVETCAIDGGAVFR